MTKTNTPMMLLAALAIGVTSTQAAVIFTENFEGTGIADGAFSNDWPNSTFTLANGVNKSNLLNPIGTGNAWLSPVPPELGEIFGVIHSGGIQQADLVSTFQANTLYTLTFTHFRRDDLPGDEIAAALFTVGGTQMATQLFPAVTTTDTFVTRTLTYTTSAAGPELGQAIRLRLLDPNGGTASSAQAGIDNIVLDATAVPEPSSALLLGVAGLALLRRRR